jgi:hypothetical protein
MILTFCSVGGKGFSNFEEETWTPRDIQDASELYRSSCHLCNSVNLVGGRVLLTKSKLMFLYESVFF